MPWITDPQCKAGNSPYIFNNKGVEKPVKKILVTWFFLVDMIAAGRMIFIKKPYNFKVRFLALLFDIKKLRFKQVETFGFFLRCRHSFFSEGAFHDACDNR